MVLAAVVPWRQVFSSLKQLLNLWPQVFLPAVVADKDTSSVADHRKVSPWCLVLLQLLWKNSAAAREVKYLFPAPPMCCLIQFMELLLYQNGGLTNFPDYFKHVRDMEFVKVSVFNHVSCLVT